MRDPRYDILFQPQQIGPLTAKNRFYQVPHCNGGGYRDPSAAAAMRGIKAEGGWGVIFTEQTEMHHTSEITPFIELRLWEDKDIPSIAKMATAIALWFGFAHLLDFLLYASIFGGALTLLLIEFRRWPLPYVLAGQPWLLRLHHNETGIPYGIALAIGALIVYPDTPWIKMVDLSRFIAG